MGECLRLANPDDTLGAWVSLLSYRAGGFEWLLQIALLTKLSQT